jgi:uncharacterized membrane protein YfcA
MGGTNSKSVFSLTLGIVSIFYAQFGIILANFLYPSHLFFLGLCFGLILAIMGLYFSRVSNKGIDIHDQNAETLLFARAGKICSIIGICLNFFHVIPIIWFLILALLPH